MNVPAPLHPKRSAHASIRGYLYQTCLGVLRWLELGPGEVLVCEGNEDLDRLFNGSNVYEQAKAYTEPVGFTSSVVTESLGNFARDYATLCKKGQQPRFVFTTTAPRKTPQSGSDLLEAWADQAKRTEVAEAVRGRLASSKLKGLAKERRWFNAKPGRWEAFVGAVEWSFGESFEGELVQQGGSHERPPPHRRRGLRQDAADDRVVQAPTRTGMALSALPRNFWIFGRAPWPGNI